MNKVILVGNIANDLELRKTNNGTSVVDFSIAINEKVNGENRVDYLEIECWGALAENVVTYCGKGSKIAVDGKLKSSTFQNKEGKNVKKVYILPNNIEFINTKKESVSNDKNLMSNPKNPTFNGDTFGDEDLPFDV